MLTSGILAAAADAASGFDWLALVERFGLPLIVLALIMSGQLVTKRENERMRSDRDEERASRQALQQYLTDELGPALTRSTDATAKSNELMDRITRRLAGE